MKVKEKSEKPGLKLNIQKTKIMTSGSIASWQIDGETMETVTDFILGGSKITADGDCSHEIKRHLFLERKAMPRQHIKKQRHYFANKGPSSQSFGFSSSHVWMWEVDYKESWAPKNWCFWTVVLKKTLESPLDCKEIKPVSPKGNQSWTFIGRTDAEAETPALWQPNAKNWLTGKDPDSGKYRRQEEKGITEDEIVGWHHWLDGHEFEQAPGVVDGHGSLACCSSWGHMTEQLNWTFREVSNGQATAISKEKNIEWPDNQIHKNTEWPENQNLKGEKYRKKSREETDTWRIRERREGKYEI